MKAWNFKVNSNPQEIAKKLDAALGAVGGFVFKMHPGANDSVTFKVRKRSLNYLNFIRENQIIVSGQLAETDADNETGVEIAFTQHFLTILYVSVFVVLGLLSIIAGISRGSAMYVYGGILLAVGIGLWIDVQKNSKKNIQKYKALIAELLEIKK
ncbi:DUF423 domain-containing protein [Mangrovibacterium lignilyticum]|uniref:DUF423 domain-containing protein n=1 Tax=Mangrovibacterium lignilyticum TaxID=2668052 RepID=UPI0013D32E38|nr:DUF423 domain-containing protein [Mangrovibacterium lignilyticum]